KGRAVLLGDAAHPMLQYLAQGAAMATEDAVCLAEKVAASPDDLPAAFDAYVQQRYLRTARVQIMARVYGDFYHARGPAAELRNQMLGSRTPEESYDGIAWLYGGAWPASLLNDDQRGGAEIQGCRPFIARSWLRGVP